jgi:hypothetical protein
VLLDTRQLVSRTLFRRRVQEVDVPDWSEVLAAPVPELDAPAELRLLLEEALRRGGIEQDELRLITGSLLPPAPHPDHQPNKQHDAPPRRTTSLIEVTDLV